MPRAGGVYYERFDPVARWQRDAGDKGKQLAVKKASVSSPLFILHRARMFTTSLAYRYAASDVIQARAKLIKSAAGLILCPVQSPAIVMLTIMLPVWPLPLHFLRRQVLLALVV